MKKLSVIQNRCIGCGNCFHNYSEYFQKEKNSIKAKSLGYRIQKQLSNKIKQECPQSAII